MESVVGNDAGQLPARLSMCDLINDASRPPGHARDHVCNCLLRSFGRVSASGRCAGLVCMRRQGSQTACLLICPSPAGVGKRAGWVVLRFAHLCAPG
eukprot:3132799-Pleurochrysis_carterae.AAC.5